GHAWISRRDESVGSGDVGVCYVVARGRGDWRHGDARPARAGHRCRRRAAVRMSLSIIVTGHVAGERSRKRYGAEVTRADRLHVDLQVAAPFPGWLANVP